MSLRSNDGSGPAQKFGEAFLFEYERAAHRTVFREAQESFDELAVSLDATMSSSPF